MAAIIRNAPAASAGGVCDWFPLDLCGLIDRITDAIRGIFDWIGSWFSSDAPPATVGSLQDRHVEHRIDGAAFQPVRRVEENSPRQEAAAPPAVVGAPPEAAGVLGEEQAAADGAPPVAVAAQPAEPPLRIESLAQYLETNPNLSPVEKVSLESARDLLAEGEPAQGFQFGFGQNVLLPTNPEIARLCAFHWDLNEQLGNAILANPQNPWSRQEVIEIADARIKIAFAIGLLLLGDLPRFCEQNGDRTLGEILRAGDSYHPEIFLYLGLQAYGWAREAYEARRVVGRALAFVAREGEIPEEHAARFYQPGTPQAEWRELYNSFCRRVAAFGELPPNFRKYVRPDENLEGYQRIRRAGD